MSILAIDPGTKQSAWLVLTDTKPNGFGILPNDELLGILRSPGIRLEHVDLVVIEEVEGYGQRVGKEVFQTVFWSGRFAEAASRWAAVDLITRRAVKKYLLGKGNGKDSGIRSALLARYGGGLEALGTPAERGPLFGITKDVWSALAVAVTAEDRLL